MFRKILLGLAAVAALVAVGVSSQTSSEALALDKVNVVSQNIELASNAGVDIPGPDVRSDKLGRSRATIRTGTKVGKIKTGFKGGCKSSGGQVIKLT